MEGALNNIEGSAIFFLLDAVVPAKTLSERKGRILKCVILEVIGAT